MLSSFNLIKYYYNIKETKIDNVKVKHLFRRQNLKIGQFSTEMYSYATAQRYKCRGQVTVEINYEN